MLFTTFYFIIFFLTIFIIYWILNMYSLNLQNCIHIEDNSFSSLSRLKKICHLNLSNCNISKLSFFRKTVKSGTK